MAILSDFLTGIADAIRSKKSGDTGTINAQNFASEIRSIEPFFETIVITENGTHNVADYKNAIVSISTSDDLTKILFEGGTIDELEIPHGVTKIRSRAFGGINIDVIKIPETVVQIGDAFTNCTLNTIYLPKSTTHISSGAFNGTKIDNNKNRTVYYAGTLDDWFKIKFDNDSDNPCFYTANDYNNQRAHLFINGVELVNLVIPSNIESIGKAAFAGCTGINNINFSSATTLRTLSQYAFYKARIEQDIVEFPNGLTTIDAHVFRYNKIKHFIIPESVKTIGIYGLETDNLETITFKSDNPSMTLNSIYDYSVRSPFLYVPKGSSDKYKALYPAYASRFFECNNITLQINSALLNNDNYQYSIDGGVTFSNFTNAIIALENISTIIFKNNSTTSSIKVGTTANGTDIGTVGSTAKLTYPTTTDATIYVAI